MVTYSHWGFTVHLSVVRGYANKVGRESRTVIPFADDKVGWNWHPEWRILELSKFLLLSLAHYGLPVAWVGQDGTATSYVETTPEKQSNGSSRSCLWCHVCGHELNIFLHTWKQYKAPMKTI